MSLLKITHSVVLTNLIKTSVLIFPILFVGACSSTGPVKSQDFFRTQIRDNHSKMFTYTMIVISNKSIANEKNGNGDNAQAKQQHKKGQGKGKGNGQGKGKGKGKNKQNNPEQSLQVSKRKKKKNNKMVELLFDGLNERLAINQYCRGGFIELERDIKRTVMTLRGECQESATKADRGQFPDTIL